MGTAGAWDPEGTLHRVWALGEVALSCFGPNGRAKLLGASYGSPAGITTSCSSRLFTSIQFKDPYCQLLLQLTAGAMQREYGDGGLLAVHVACRLIAAGLQPGVSHAARDGMCHTYQRALAAITRAWGQHRGPQTSSSSHHPSDNDSAGSSSDGSAGGDAPGSDGPAALAVHPEPGGGRAQAYIALARGVLSPKRAAGLTSADIDAAALLAVRAAVACAPATPRLTTVPGLATEHWELLAGVLLDYPAVPSAAAPLPPAHSRVAVFSTPLEPDNCHEGTMVLEHAGEDAPSAPWHPTAVGVHRLISQVKALHMAGVRLLACQQGVHEEVAGAAAALGMMALARLGTAGAQHLAASTGARLMSAAVPPADVHAWLGVVGSVTFRRVGPRVFLHVQGIPDAQQQTAHTLVLGASSARACDELCACMGSTLRILRGALLCDDPPLLLLPGGGCAEAVLAARVRELRGGSTAARDALASALEDAACAVAGLCARDAVHCTAEAMLMQLRLQSGTVQCIGWDASTAQFTPVATCHWAPQPPGGQQLHLESAAVLDSLPVKLGAVCAAVAAACSLLRVDGVLLAATG